MPVVQRRLWACETRQRSIVFVIGNSSFFRHSCFVIRHCKQSRGSLIAPASALAATVSGLARNTFASLCPMRPGKLRLVVLMHESGVLSRPKGSLGPPRQAAQEG